MKTSRPVTSKSSSLFLRHCGIICAGTGRVYTWTVIHAPTLPAFAALTPYAAGLIELDEHVFMTGQIRGVDPHAITQGLRVRVEFDDVTDDVSLPHWRMV